MKPFQGLFRISPILTQGALEDSRPWAVLWNRFAVVLNLADSNCPAIACPARRPDPPMLNLDRLEPSSARRKFHPEIGASLIRPVYYRHAA